MNNQRRWVFVVAALAAMLWEVAAVCAGQPLSLAGQWRFQLDRSDVGVREHWFDRALPETIQLPGSLPAQGIGDNVTVDTKWTGGIVDRSWFTAAEYEPYRQPDNVKVPFWLQPDKYYVGVAWYQRDIGVPEEWLGKRVVIVLERPHWETHVWINGRAAGSRNSLSTSHEYDLGPLSPGKHQLTIRVDNRMIVDVGENSHSVSDHTQGNWNGIVGRIELSARDSIRIESQRIFPENDGSVRVEVRLHNDLFDPVAGAIHAQVCEKGSSAVLGKASAEFSYPGGHWKTQPNFATKQTKDLIIKLDKPPKLWSEFSPALYEVETRLEAAEGHYADTRTDTFGFRQVGTSGTQFTLNGQKIFFRGTLECCIFPKTGHPPTEVAEWKRIIGVAKSHGLNLMRFHSWCPPEAAFVAADELGFYLHVECASWANMSTTLGDGKPVDQWLYDEADRILATYGNHPCFLLMPYGNEPGGKQAAAYLKKWVAHYKAQDPRRLYTSGAGWPELPENQFHVLPAPRIQAWGSGLKSRINAKPPETRTDYRDYIQKRTVPVISHEIGQWCVYPNFDEIPKYTGYLKPRNFEIFRDRLNSHGMADLARQFLLASGKLQTLCYKEDIESALRTPGMGGFELLDLHDFPGQGTALVGVLDPFWESKGYVTPAEYRRFCNATVPLARLSKRVFTTEDTLEADIEVAHFGAAPIPSAVAAWKLIGDDDKVVANGTLPAKTIPVDNGIVLGSVRVPLSRVPAPARYKLVVGIEAEKAENDWDVWVYPAGPEMQPPAGVMLVEELGDAALTALDAGGKVLLLIPPKQVRNAEKDKVLLGFSSIFWNTAWTRRQPPTTLGILCDPQHAALAEFLTEYHSNWQWWYLVSRSGAMILDDLPRDLRPIVQVIDDWFTARKLGLVFEAKLGKGKLVVCSIDLQHGLDENAVARQMRASLLRYMAGDRFDPKVEVTKEAIMRLMSPSKQ